MFLSVALIAASLIAGLGLSGQPASRCHGTVLDFMKRGIPNAMLILVSVESQTKREARSDEYGRFELPGLPDGKYLLDAQQMGFKTQKLVIEIEGKDVHQDLTLQLGGLTETVRVRGLRRAQPRPSSPKYKPEPCTDNGSGGVIRPPMKLVHVVPEYPELLFNQQVEGTVRLTGRLASDGSIATIEAVGNPNTGLRTAALDAVRQWRYSPTFLNCVPVELAFETTIHFVLR